MISVFAKTNKETIFTISSILHKEEFLLDLSQFHILATLYRGPCQGFQIIGRLRNSVDKEVNPSVVYSFLRLLRRRGLVRCSVGRLDENKRKVYGLTKEGEEVCRGLFERFAVLVSTAIEPGMKICANCGCVIHDRGYSEVVEGRMRTFCCIHCSDSVKQGRGIAEDISSGKNILLSM